MKRVIFFISFMFICHLFDACQIFVANNVKNETTNNESQNNNPIFGLWENSTNNSDGPPSICAVKFEVNNEFIFYPALGYGNNIFRKGYYKITGDTLSLHFTVKKYSEEYLFGISKNELSIKPLINQYSRYSLTGSIDNRIFVKKKILDTYYFEQFKEEAY